MSQSGEGSVWYQREIAISAKKRGCHLITDDVLHQVPEIQKIKIGTANVHIKHTSASLCLNENWDPDVRVDMEMMMNKLIPEYPLIDDCCRVDMEMMMNKLIPEVVKHTSASLCLNENWDPDVRQNGKEIFIDAINHSTPFKHSCEGPDDMPAHVKAAFIGTGVTIPISNGKFNLGTWQGLWLCEHRNSAGQ
uniref:UPF0047 protein yjbQ n=1 Tax=Magallana gigas TaxID=29159 RepID=K1R8K2_MAGGI